MSTLRNLIHEIHRRSLWQVLGIYGVASWVIYQVVLALYEGIGLPGWVPGTALVLLLIGLPIVMATAFVQEGGPRGDRAPMPADGSSPALDGLVTAADSVSASPADPHRTDAPPPQDGPQPADPTLQDARSDATGRHRTRLFTWNRAITGGVLAFAALGLATTGFMGMRTLGVGPAATLISSGQLEERAPVLLADFESLTGDAVLSRVVTEAFRADLAQSQAIDLANPEDVAYVLERMDRDADAALDAATAREVAARAGMKAVVAGDIGQIGGRYVLSARIIGSLDGEVLLTQRATAADSTELVDAIDRLAKSIREEIGESLRSIRRSPYLSAITTPSLQALKKLIQAYDAHNGGEEDRALTLLAEAIELDPEFSEAHRKRAAILFNQGRTGDAIAAIDRALEHPERLSDYERYHARALRAVNAGELRPALSEYRALLELDSTDSRALNNMGNVYLFLGEWERMEEALRRSLEVRDQGPEGSVYGPGYSLLAGARWNLGYRDSAQASLEALEGVAPDHPEIPRMGAVLAAAAGDYGRAEELIDRLLADHPGSAQQFQGRSGLASIRATRGRVAEALQEVDAVAGILRDRGDPARSLQAELLGVLLAARVSMDSARAADWLADIRSRYPVEAVADVQLGLLARAYAAVGAVDSARTMLQRFREEPAWVHAGWPSELPRVRGAIAAAEGDYEAAGRFWRAAHRALPGCPICDLPRIALAEEMRGNRSAAIEAYEEFLETRHWFRGILIPEATGDPFERGFTLERLGVLHEESGNHAEAARYYGAFVELWEDADPELQPRVEAARRALGRLAAEPSS